MKPRTSTALLAIIASTTSLGALCAGSAVSEALAGTTGGTQTVGATTASSPAAGGGAGSATTTSASTSTSVSGGALPAQAAPPEPTTMAYKRPFSLQIRTSAVLGAYLDARGNVGRRHRHDQALLERFDATSGHWLIVARSTITSRGAFLVRWRTDTDGRFGLRVAVSAGAPASASSATADETSPPTNVSVYSSGVASYYGPGPGLATTYCGQALLPGTIGVAHRTLPCGTLVEFFYAGHVLTVPVIDRGPFVTGRDWDLTTGAVAELGGFDGLATVGVMVVGQVVNSPFLGAPGSIYPVGIGTPGQPPPVDAPVAVAPPSTSPTQAGGAAAH